jgi:transcriptional regulator with XRE-family HTH domain
MREGLGWIQADLAEASGVSVPTIGLIETDKPAKRGERGSVTPLLRALDDERNRRMAEAPVGDAQLMEFLARRDLEDVRMRRVGRHRKVRWLSVAIPDPDATPEQIAEDLEDYHRQQRGLPPNG